MALESILTGKALAAIAAAVALGGAGIGSMIGLKNAGVAAAGAVAENKENFTNALVLQALPQTQVVYGFITALFIAMGAGLLGAVKEISVAEGFVMLGVAVLVALTGLSGIFQGIVSAAGIVSCSKNKEGCICALCCFRWPSRNTCNIWLYLRIDSVGSWLRSTRLKRMRKCS